MGQLWRWRFAVSACDGQEFRWLPRGVVRRARGVWPGFVALPIVGQILWGLTDTLLSDRNQQKWSVAFVGGFIAFFSIAGTHLAVRFLAGLIRLWRGAADLGKEVTVEGVVVKVHEGYVAGAPGAGATAGLGALIVPAQFSNLEALVRTTTGLPLVPSDPVDPRQAAPPVAEAAPSPDQSPP